jgi:hypothetical protein
VRLCILHLLACKQCALSTGKAPLSSSPQCTLRSGEHAAIGTLTGPSQRIQDEARYRLSDISIREVTLAIRNRRSNNA